MAEVKPDIETFARIKVIGVGGGGGSAINRMVDGGIKGVEFVAINTDIQALHYSRANEKIHIGKETTKGLGAGMDPELGKNSAEESRNEIKEAIEGCDMVFVTTGLGGGTGSGASPIVAQIARDLGALTVAVVTKPFMFEGGQRKNISERAYSELADKVDTIITISNDKLLQVIDKRTSLLEAFVVADDVLRQGVQGIAEIITVPGIINADFADVKAVMQNAGSALMGIGQASGEDKAVEAAKSAISSNLLDMSIEGAQGIVFTVTGGPDLSMSEVSEAAKVITAAADEDAKIIFGAVIDEKLNDEVKITVVATGFDGKTKSVAESSKTYTPNTFIEKETNKERSQNTNLWGKVKTKKEDEDTKLEKTEDKPFKPLVEKKPETKKTEEKKSEDKKDDNEDLDVPAFIRKKMN